MSRKTRKLIWSAPLVAVLAVVGALAIFAALAPDGAQAHEAAMHGPPGPVTGLTAMTATGSDANGEVAGRTQIDLTWMMPAEGMGGPAAGYRIDYSDNTRVWYNLMPMVSDASADMDCDADAAEGMRCFTDMDLTPGTTRHYRVFAMNDFGASPVSVEPTYDTATTMGYANPTAVLGLSASTHYVDQIVLDWQRPTDTGGADIVLYCLAVGTSETDIPDPTAAANAATCRDAITATEGDVAAGVATIVVPGDTTTYTQGGLTARPVISQHYRAYVVTDTDGDPTTATDRRISLAASNIANGRTVAPLPNFETPETETPNAVTNLRWVAGIFTDGTDTDNELRLYWTHPSNYPDVAAAGDPDLRANWSAQVQRWNQATETWVAVAGDTTPDGVSQWSSAADAVDELATAPQQYRVRYINNAGTADNTDDDAEGVSVNVNVPLLDATADVAANLPQIAESPTDGNGPTGLRFGHNEINPMTWIDLMWDADENGNDDVPTGYVIDMSQDGGTTWVALPNAMRPTDLGATTQYTHKGVIPGDEYTYRVFPELGSRFGIPAREDASSREAGLPDPVRGLTVTADPESPQTSLVLTWPMVTEDGGHEILGYLVQVGNDVDNNAANNNTATAWESLGTDTSADPAVRVTVDVADPTTYTYDGSAAATPETLAGGYVRWFRVFAITAENDGDTATGGAARNVTDGAAVDPRSPGESSPTAADIASAEPASGKTDDPSGPVDPPPPTPPLAPMDLTVEQASDTNLIEPFNRGVLLLWNDPNGEIDIGSYVVQRMVDGGAWTTIGVIAWNAATPVDERTSFSDSREYIEGEDLQYRVGSRGVAATETSYTEPVTYPTHPTMHMPGMPQDVTAMADSDTAVTVSWTPPLDDGGSAVIGYTVMYRMTGSDGDDMSMDAAADATSATVSDLMASTSYDFQVIATNAAGDSDPSMTVTAMTEDPPVTGLTAPTDVMAVVDDSDPGNAMVTVTWMDGANADRHVVILFDSNLQTRADWIAGNQTDMTTTFSNVPSGMYTAVVVAVENGPTGNAMNIEYGAAMATVN